MKKVLIGIIVAAVVVAVLGTAGFVYAQGPQPGSPGSGWGQSAGTGGWGGMMGGRGGMMSQRGYAGTQDGFMHDDMIAAFAQKLGLTVDELNSRLAKGETMYQIATSKGFDATQFQALMSDARNQAIDQAVKEGTLTQAQADWMKQRGAGMMAGGRGMRGAGRGANGYSTCPFASPAQP